MADMIQATIIQSHMYKSWIQANPELAQERIEAFYREASERGMILKYHENEHYVDIVAAYKETDLNWGVYYA